jgi:UDP-2,3-diacylglucosamine hydrolase
VHAARRAVTLAGARTGLGAGDGRRRAGSGEVPARIGIVAGAGRLPLLLAERLAARGVGVHIIGLEGEADAAIAAFAHSWVRWGEIGRMLTTLRQEDCRELVIAGAVRRPDLWKLRPDAGLIRNLPRLARLLVGGDDRVLTRVVRFFEHRGLSVRGAHELAPELLAAAGRIGEVALTATEEDDAQRGFAVRRALQGVDAGQAVVVAAGRVLAIEGVEGTDVMLQRLAAAGGSRQRSGVLAKGPKPGQELRVDMPAIGPRTILNALAAGLAGVVVEAGAVLLLDRPEMLRMADTRGCAVHGLAEAFPARMPRPATCRGRVIGRYRPTYRDRRDLERGVTAVAALAGVGVRGAAIVASAHVLAIEPGDGAAAMLQRAATLRQWGLSGRRRTGVFVCDADAAARGGGMETLFAHASQQRLAGVVIMGAAQLLAPYEMGARLADELELFLVVCDETRWP